MFYHEREKNNIQAKYLVIYLWHTVFCVPNIICIHVMFGSVSIAPSYSYSHSRHSCAKRPFAIAIRYYERKKCLFCVIVGVCMCFLLPPYVCTMYDVRMCCVPPALMLILWLLLLLLMLLLLFATRLLCVEL